MSDSNITEHFYDFQGYSMQAFNITNPTAHSDFIFIGGFSDPVQNHFDIFNELVKKGYSVWALNMPGHGKSEQIESVDWDMLVEIVKTFIMSTEITKHIIGGFSMGGGVAIMYAGIFPENIEAIRVLSPFCYGLPSIKEAFIGGAKFTFDFLRNRMRNPSNKPAPSSEIYPVYYLQNYRAVIMRPIKVVKEALKEISFDVVVGKADEVVDHKLIEKVLGPIPGVQVRIVDGLGHDIYFVEPQMIENIVENLVK